MGINRIIGHLRPVAASPPDRDDPVSFVVTARYGLAMPVGREMVRVEPASVLVIRRELAEGWARRKVGEIRER